MAQLHRMKCAPCEGGVSPMRGALLTRYMKHAKGWKLVKGKRIVKEYTFRNDAAALLFLQKTGKVSVSQGHHPVAVWVYNRVSMEFWTHAIKGLSVNDFIMAAKFDRIYNKTR